MLRKKEYMGIRLSIPYSLTFMRVCSQNLKIVHRRILSSIYFSKKQISAHI